MDTVIASKIDPNIPYRAQNQNPEPVLGWRHPASIQDRPERPRGREKGHIILLSLFRLHQPSHWPRPHDRRPGRFLRGLGPRLRMKDILKTSSAEEENILGNVALSPPAEEENILANVSAP